MFGFGQKKKLGFNFMKGAPTTSWEIDKEIGEGSFAHVYLAKKKTDGKLAALKSAILIDEESYQADTEDLVNEIKIMQMMKSEHIIKFFEAYYEETKPPVIHLLIEYCHGKSLDTLIAARVEVSEEQLKAVLYQTCCGLAYMHDHFVIHRDIKSLNILINDVGTIKLADFGVSAICPENKMVRSSFVGSLNWMSPEVLLTSFDTNQTYNEKCDIWSLGITAIEMAEICVPYSHLNTQSIMHRIIEGEPPRLSAPSIWSREFNDFVTNTVIKNPSHRLSANECLKHPFLDNDAAHSNAPVLELLFVQISEVIEEIHEAPSSPDLSNDSEDISSIIICPDQLPLPITQLSVSSIGKRTVRKTIRYKMNGEIKEKTIVEDLDEAKRLPNRKCVKDIVLDQKEFNRNIKMEHKLKKAMELQITTILEETDKRHDLEKLQVLDKMRKELDLYHKNCNKECERQQAKDDGAQQKFYKKLRQEFEAHKKKIVEKYKDRTKEAKKSKISKEEILNMDDLKNEIDTELSDLSGTFLTEWNKFIESQNKLYSEMCVGHATTRNKRVDELEMDLWQTDLKHVLEMYVVKYMCELMPVNLQISQFNKRHLREEGLISQYNQKMEEEMEARHARELKDAPKSLSKQSNANFNEYKKLVALDKNIPKQKRKEMLEARCAEEKALIEKGLAEVASRHESEKAAMKKKCAQYVVELASYQKQERFDIYQLSMTKRLSSLSTFENVAANKIRALYRKKMDIITSQNELINSAIQKVTKVLAVSFH